MSALEFLTSQIRVIRVLKDTERTKISIIYHDTMQMTCVLRECRGRDMTGIYRALKNVRSRALSVVYECFYENGTTYILEEYLNGSTISEHLKYKGTFSEKQTVQIISEVCSALEILHACKPPVIHNDIKPSNIMLCADGSVKLFDFDISRTYKRTASQNTELMGTQDYASPEHYGYGQSEPRTDIYSLGVTMHKMLTGKELTASHTQTYRGRLRKIIKKCTETDPKNRYASVRALEKALRAYRRPPKALLLIPICAVLLISALSLPSVIGNLMPKTQMPEQSTPAQTEKSEQTETPIQTQKHYPAPDLQSMVVTADGQLLWIEKTEDGHILKTRDGALKAFDFDPGHVCALAYNKLSQKLYVFDINCGFTTAIYELSGDCEPELVAKLPENGMRDIRSTSFFSDGSMLSECISGYFDTESGIITAPHDFDRAYVINDRVYTLLDGCIYENGKTGEVLREIPLERGYRLDSFLYCDSSFMYVSAIKSGKTYLLRFDGEELLEVMEIQSEHNGYAQKMCAEGNKVWFYSEYRGVISEYTVS
ncbi:MAG: protein kinase [Clostridia bacterium]|nr:protein kinase [Clostridia bacterium]